MSTTVRRNRSRGQTPPPPMATQPPKDPAVTSASASDDIITTTTNTSAESPESETTVTTTTSLQITETEVTDTANPSVSRETDNTIDTNSGTTEIPQAQQGLEPTTEVKAPTETTSALPEKFSGNAAVVVSILEQYKIIMSFKIITAENLRRGASLLHQATAIVIRFAAAEPDVIRAYLKFHVDHKDTLMSENMALRGTDRLKPLDGNMVSLVYSAFRRRVVDGRKGIDVSSLTTTVFKGDATIPQFLATTNI